MGIETKLRAFRIQRYFRKRPLVSGPVGPDARSGQTPEEGSVTNHSDNVKVSRRTSRSVTRRAAAHRHHKVLRARQPIKNRYRFRVLAELMCQLTLERHIVLPRLFYSYSFVVSCHSFLCALLLCCSHGPICDRYPKISHASKQANNVLLIELSLSKIVNPLHRHHPM